MLFRNLMFGLLCGIVAALGPITAQAAETAVIEQTADAVSGDNPTTYADNGAKTCLKCHDTQPVVNVLNTPHAVKGDARTPMGEHGCESCHGASPLHVKPEPGKTQKTSQPTVVFKGEHISAPAERVKMCIACHESNLRMNWKGSQHQSSDVACDNCHTIHANKDPLLVKKTQAEKCFTCHAEQRAQSYLFSHHPVREGKVVCADCHNPHGTPGPKLLRENTVNELCYNCHTEKRGPYLFEHQPVRESCLNCHQPHGSTQARLWTERPPYLCQNCHDNAHQANPMSGNSLPGANLNAGVTTKTSTGVSVAAYGVTNSILLSQRACTNCHTQIHGSNSPAGSHFLR